MKLCSDCLSLSIDLLCKSIQPFERDRQEMCVIKKRGKLQLRCSKSQNVDWKKIVVEKFVGQYRHFQSMLTESEWKTKN